jgi:hypothetical protein
MEVSDGSESDGDFSNIKKAPESEEETEEPLAALYPLEGKFKNAADRSESAFTLTAPSKLIPRATGSWP